MATFKHLPILFLIFFQLQKVFGLLKENELQKAFVTYDSKADKLSIVTSEPIDYVAKADFQNSVNSTCWSYLDVTTNPQYNDSMQAYAAGMVEGFLTKELIQYSWQNTAADYCTQPYNQYCKNLQKFLTQNYNWVKTEITQNFDSPFWHNVRLFYTQVSGLDAGFTGTPKQVNYDVDVLGMFYILQLSGDLEDLESVLHKPQKSHVLGSGSCSAIVKLTPGNKDLYVAQDTWTGFNEMLRVLKRYNFAYRMSETSSVPQSPQGVFNQSNMGMFDAYRSGGGLWSIYARQKETVPGQVLTFSSYPGSITSGDDYYLLSSGMVSMETTIGNSNADLWKYVQPTGIVLEMVRSVVSNRISKSGAEWAASFANFNSGTYNNEWMIVDYKRFVPGQTKLIPGLLTVLEQIPGYIKYADLTSLLETTSYFPSYNVAYFPEIFNMSGGNEMVKKFGDWFSYNYTARANIFRRDHEKAQDIDSVMKLMRYNDYKHDPLSRCNCTPPYSAENAISARCDLNPDSGTYPIPSLSHRAHGGIDMKLTNYELFQSMEMITVGGPTYDDLPPFQWSKSDFSSQYSHLGHPDLFQFKPVRFNGKVPAVPYVNY